MSARLLADVSDRDMAILRTVSEFKVASTRQLESLHFPSSGNGSALTAARRCRRVLERLTAHHLLERLERRIGGVRAGSGSWLYRLGSAGLRSLGLDGRPAWREPSRWFVDHLLAVGDVHVRLAVAESTRAIDTAHVVHEPDCWRRFLAAHGGTETLKPDLQVDITTSSDELRWFVEVDRATENLTTIARKCQAYERYWRSGSELQRSDIFPRVLWLVPNERRMNAIRQTIAERRDITDELHLVALQDDAIDALTGSNQQHEGGER